MPTENKPAAPFQREDRYIVIKRSDVDTFWRDDVREQFMSALERLNEHHVRTPQRQFLVIESDWPEYEPAWQMIEQRVNGVAGRLPEVVAVINEEGEHFKETVVKHRPGIDRLPVGTELVDRDHVKRLQAERDALQLRLNAAEQRIDDLAAAAEPFAKLADLYAREEDNSHEPCTDLALPAELRLTLGQFRALNDLCTSPLIKP